MAQHEQGEVLQGLIYNDKDFIKTLDLQRKVDKATTVDKTNSNKWWTWPSRRVHAMIPPLQLSFTAEKYADDDSLRSDAKKDGPPDMKLENYVDRMAWILSTGKLFHFLMKNKRDYMLSELSKIAAKGGVT